MHLVVAKQWGEVAESSVQAIASALGITAFEVNQRINCGSPTAVTGFADSQQAEELADKLEQLGISAMTVDTDAFREREGTIIVHRFVLKPSSIRIETQDRKTAEIPYEKISVLVPATSTVSYSNTKTVTERKISVGKTLLTGIPMMSKSERTEKVSGKKHQRVLYLYLGKRPQPLIFTQNGTLYEGLGDMMKISRELNFNFLVDELHRRSPTAYDDRLIKKLGQTRLLGPTLNPETYIDLAAEILARTLRDN